MESSETNTNPVLSRLKSDQTVPKPKCSVLKWFHRYFIRGDFISETVRASED